MVGAEHDVTEFPGIELAGTGASRRVRIASRGITTRVEFESFHTR
jgi:hypothetical protein